MFSRISLLAVFFLFASMVLLSSASPIAEVESREMQPRICKFACRIAEPVSESATESSTTETSTPEASSVTAESSAEALAASTSTPVVAPSSAAIAPSSSPQSSGALFSVNTPALSHFIALGASAGLFAFLL